MSSRTSLIFGAFIGLGREQWLVQTKPLLAMAYRVMGPLGLHSRIRTGAVLQAIVAHRLPSGAKVLDAGSGRGLLCFYLAQRNPGWQIRGIELDEALVTDCRRIAEALELSNLSFEVGDVACIADSEIYDLIVSVDVLEHVNDDEGALCNFYRALHPGARLILHLPLRHQLQRRWFQVFNRHAVSDHVRDEYTEDEIRAKLARVGFRVERLETHFGPWGELAFELNNLFWWRPWLRHTLALLTFPVASLLAYQDLRRVNSSGNSFLVEALRW